MFILLMIMMLGPVSCGRSSGFFSSKTRKVICDRESNGSDWWITPTQYFICNQDQHCCGDAWNRTCCDKENSNNSTMVIITVVMVIVILLLLLLLATYNVRIRSRYYVRVANLWNDGIFTGSRPKYKLNINNSYPDEPSENHQKEEAPERKQELPERKHDLSRQKDLLGNNDDRKLPYAESNDVLSINTLPSSVEETLENGFRSRIRQLSSVSPVGSSIPFIAASKPLQGDLRSSLMKYEPYQIMTIDQESAHWNQGKELYNPVIPSLLDPSYIPPPAVYIPPRS